MASPGYIKKEFPKDGPQLTPTIMMTAPLPIPDRFRSGLALGPSSSSSASSSSVSSSLSSQQAAVNSPSWGFTPASSFYATSPNQHAQQQQQQQQFLAQIDQGQGQGQGPRISQWQSPQHQQIQQQQQQQQQANRGKRNLPESKEPEHGAEHLHSSKHKKRKTVLKDEFHEKIRSGKERREQALQRSKELRKPENSRKMWNNPKNVEMKKRLQIILPKIAEQKQLLSESRKELKTILSSFEIQDGEMGQMPELRMQIQRGLTGVSSCDKNSFANAHEMWLLIEKGKTPEVAANETQEFLKFYDDSIHFLPELKYKTELKEVKKRPPKEKKKKKKTCLYMVDKDGEVVKNPLEEEKKVKLQSRIEAAEARISKRPQTRNCIQKFLIDLAEKNGQGESMIKAAGELSLFSKTSISSLLPPALETEDGHSFMTIDSNMSHHHHQ